MRLKNVALAGALSLLFGSAHATLFDRGGGLLYDDVLKITWLQDANYAKTIGYDADGKMNWIQANEWAANLTYSDSVRGVTHDDWRLASYTASGMPFHFWWYAVPVPGDSGSGGPHTELSYMSYVNLGLSQTGVFGNYAIGGQKDIGLVRNLQSDFYLLGGTAPNGYQQQVPWVYAANDGDHRPSGEYSYGYAWAVRDGDVASIAAPIPEPETYAMMLAGLGLLGAVARRRKHKMNA